MQELQSILTQHYGMLGRDPMCIEYLARFILDSACESHGLKVFKRHIMRRWGSAAGAWRKYFGTNRLMPFSKFRDVCKELKCREHSTSYWEELDIGRGGCISLYELDPESVSLLAKFRSRLLALADVTNADEVDADTLWQRLTFPIRCNREGRLEVGEFKNTAKPLGFSGEESVIIFNCLDPAGGHCFRPPAYISISDIGWVKRLHQFVDLECISLSNGEGINDTDGLRFVTWNSRSTHNDRKFEFTDRPAPGDAGSLPSSPVGLNGVPTIDPPHWAKPAEVQSSAAPSVAAKSEADQEEGLEGDDGEDGEEGVEGEDIEESELQTHSELQAPPTDTMPAPLRRESEKKEPTPVTGSSPASEPEPAAAIQRGATAESLDDDYEEAEADGSEDEEDYDEADADEGEESGAIDTPDNPLLDLEEETF